MNGVPVPRVRRVPLNWCETHRHVGVWAEDGTDKWHCDDCLADALHYAEQTLRLDRAIHQNHKTRGAATCPFCNPGRVA